MQNLLHETTQKITEHGHTVGDVRWVGNYNLWMTWAEFARLADDTYDDGFGGNEVPLSLLVVGDDWWIERHEYDGSEWWEHKALPIRPNCHHVPPLLFGWDAERAFGERLFTQWVCPE